MVVHEDLSISLHIGEREGRRIEREKENKNMNMERQLSPFRE